MGKAETAKRKAFETTAEIYLKSGQFTKKGETITAHFPNGETMPIECLEDIHRFTAEKEYMSLPLPAWQVHKFTAEYVKKEVAKTILFLLQHFSLQPTTATGRELIQRLATINEPGTEGTNTPEAKN